MRYYDWDFGFGFGRRHRAHAAGFPDGGGRGYDAPTISGRSNQGYSRSRRSPDRERERPGHYSGRATGHGGREDEFGRAGTSDQALRQAVRESLYRDRFVDADAIQVEANDGVVTLTGEVEDFWTARYAWDDAWETAGVRGVISQLDVRTDQP